MIRLPFFQSRPKADSIAMRWHVESDAKPLTPTEEEDFQEWAAESEDHRLAYESADRFVQAIDGLSQSELDALGDDPLDRSTGGMNDWLRRSAVAAIVGTVAVCAWWFVAGPRPDFITATGEMRTVVLDDGSIMEMNTATAVNVELSPEMRRVSIINGEVFFRVASDTARPFEVAVGSGHVLALGTAFNIRKEETSSTVSVQEHAVQVSSLQDRDSQKVPVGYEVTIQSNGTIGEVQTYSQEKLAWRRQRIVFVDRPLGEVLTELNRYRPGYIIPVDSTLHDLTVTAIFDTQNPEKALRTIEMVLPVHMVRLTDRLVFLFRKTS